MTLADTDAMGRTYKLGKLLQFQPPAGEYACLAFNNKASTSRAASAIDTPSAVAHS